MEAVLIGVLLVLILLGFNRKSRSYRPGMEALLVAAFSMTLIENWWLIPYPAPSYVYVFLVLAASLLYGTRSGLMLSVTIALLVLASTQLLSKNADSPEKGYVAISILIASLVATALLAGHLTIGQRRKTQNLQEELLLARAGPLGSTMEGDPNLQTSLEFGAEPSGGEIESLQESIRSILQRIKESLGAYSVLLYQPYSENSLALRYFVSDATDFDRSRLLDVKHTLLGQIFNQQTSSNWNLDDSNSKISFKDIPYYSTWKPIRQIAGCPLRFSDLTLGVLVVDRTTQRVFTEVEILHLEIFAIQLVEMIQVGKLYLDQLDRNKEYRLFYRAMSALGQSLATEEVLESLANSCQGVVPFTHLVIALLEDNGMAYQIAISRGNERLKGQRIKSAGTWMWWILNADPGPLLLKDIRSHTSSMPIIARSEGDMPVRSVLFIQLKAKGRKLGALFLGSAEPDSFHHRHLRMLNLICQHASANIENSLLHQRVERESLSDDLTQLHNHRFFQERLAKEVSRARRSKSQLTLLMADIDKFKSVNDSYGHRIGDMVLRRVAEILKKTIRTEDSIARYGGEEFVIILTESDRKGGMLMAERLRNAIERVTFPLEGNSISITISIGAATYPADGGEPWELIEHADQALYAAKDQGRNRAVQYDTIAPARNSAS